jgi:hypothetical protein
MAMGMTATVPIFEGIRETIILYFLLPILGVAGLVCIFGRLNQRDEWLSKPDEAQDKK